MPGQGGIKTCKVGKRNFKPNKLNDIRPKMYSRFRKLFDTYALCPPDQHWVPKIRSRKPRNVKAACGS